MKFDFLVVYRQYQKQYQNTLGKPNKIKDRAPALLRVGDEFGQKAEEK
jgi:hypothetical protein